MSPLRSGGRATFPEAGDRWNFGNIVFFDNLKHCGIVDTRETFYHAAVSAGTHRSEFDPFWRRKISGVRAMPKFKRQGTTAVGEPAPPLP